MLVVWKWLIGVTPTFIKVCYAYQSASFLNILFCLLWIIDNKKKKEEKFLFFDLVNSLLYQPLFLFVKIEYHLIMEMFTTPMGFSIYLFFFGCCWNCIMLSTKLKHSRLMQINFIIPSSLFWNKKFHRNQSRIGNSYRTKLKKKLRETMHLYIVGKNFWKTNWLPINYKYQL